MPSPRLLKQNKIPVAGKGNGVTFNLVKMTIVIGLVWLPVTGAVHADNSRVLPAASAVAAERGERGGHADVDSADREKMALAFLKQNHAELAGLLRHLQAGNPAAYEKAINDLWRAKQRLDTVRRRDTERYELELRDWTIQSRIHLVLAKLKMVDNDDLRQELRMLLDDQANVKLLILTDERRRATERLKKIDEQLSKFEQSRDETVDKRYSLLLRSIKSPANKLPAKASSRRAKAIKPDAAESLQPES